MLYIVFVGMDPRRRMSAALQPLLVVHLRFSFVQILRSVDEGITRKEAALKMAIADSIFDDIIGDTAEAFLDAHGLQEPPESAPPSNSS